MDSNAEHRLSQLLDAHKIGIFSEREMACQFGLLVKSVGLDELLARVSSELVPLIKQGLTVNNRAAADNEFLRPEDSPFDNLSTYYQNVANVLFGQRGFGAPRFLRIICIPSFQPEWALVLVGSNKGKDFSLVLCKPDTQIWSSREGPITAKRLEREIPQEVALELCEIWQTMLFHSRYSELGSVGLDGVTYHFEKGPMAAQTWSPDPQTGPGKLVSLCHLLYRFVEELDGDANVGEVRQAIEDLKDHCRARFGGPT